VKRILIAEDDAEIAAVEKDYMEINGMEADVAVDGNSALKMLMTKQYDLLLLDIMMPGKNGYALCKEIRASIDIPILMVTAKIAPTDKIRGLGFGADDYITKPFDPAELVARVKANLAQYERLKNAGADNGNAETKAAVIQIGSIKINTLTHRAYVNESEIELKNKEYELLLFLMSNPDIVFSKEQLYDRIWGMDAFGELKTVIVHINRLREKIETDPKIPKYIQTVWGAGYRFGVGKR
jgi:DNA-binding response OmpR family regulator